ncbi:universal stress protein [Xylophilus rhododendri]|uniref:Universal stress protein n=1 Tax=Xylophilus rhododendri TaxID=2697032 RepID=A0A857J0V1_9BURK|nr:universal stress protein [Xylophilus rhododendri]QHI96722.1 universal stress protein [Xylophilus rhododendri]
MNHPASILLHLDASRRCAQHVQLARQVAERFDARVTAQLCTSPAVLDYPYAVDCAAGAVQAFEQLDQQSRDRAFTAFLQAAAGSPRLQWSEADNGGPWAFGRRAMYHDLAIVGQRDPHDPAADALPADFVPELAAASGRPVLVLPSAGPLTDVGDTVLLAWKESPEAVRALSAALPWMQKAGTVHAVCWGEATESARAALSALLSAHGIRATVHGGNPAPTRAGEALLTLAAELDADLLAMGCYGHSRTREWVLGGVTRTVLRAMSLPVLMVH